MTQIYIVLGMHKSGTTLITQILHKSGINMGEFDELKSYDEGNQYERKESQQINIDLLNCRYLHSLEVKTPVREMNRESDISKQIKNFVFALNNKYHCWGFKDPRTCLTYPVWKRYLPAHKVIFVYRHPLEVWHHYQKYVPTYKIFQKIKTGWNTLVAWHVYNDLLLREIEKTDNKNYLICDFNSFILKKDAILKLTQFVGHSLIDCRKTELYRDRQKSTLLYIVLKMFFRFFKKGNIDSIYKALVQKHNKFGL